MTKHLLASATLAAFLAVPSSGFADGGPSRVQGDTLHHYSLAHGRVASNRAAQALRAQHLQYEREGLTRNPNACVVYGCIGNN
jgi:hypothetical protein